VHFYQKGCLVAQVDAENKFCFRPMTDDYDLNSLECRWPLWLQCIHTCTLRR